MLDIVYTPYHSHATYSAALFLLGSNIVIQSLPLPIIRSRKA